MHGTQVATQESNTKKIIALEGKVFLLEQKIKDLDENYDKLYKWMMEKSEVIQKA
ncbi:hypothetical protein LCGC14_2208120 [marine sediment metagenome]|uniref:Uncharacterized protein n=1 Tax=marine sediment metagenome TaxID=412755 RepID=A0A0F9DET2_9ZZZZ